MNDSKLRDQINSAIEMRDSLIEDTIKEINHDYSIILNRMRELCDHNYDDDISALVRAGYPWHSGWDRCLVCGKFVETSEFGRDEE